MALKRIIYQIFLSSNTLILLIKPPRRTSEGYEVDDTHLVCNTHLWVGRRGARGRNIVAGLTDRNAEHCIIFDKVFLFSFEYID